MFIAYLVTGAIVFGLILYFFSREIEKRHNASGRGLMDKPVRDMWTATMLDCDYEATKHAFGPGRTLHLSGDYRSRP
ncbi:MAG: hypothetical protein ACW97A_00585 [Candidatus Thorarchaeota archaeon]|jgi:hypothetical protein